MSGWRGSDEPGGEQRLVLVVGDAARLAVEHDEDRSRSTRRARDALDERREVAVEEDDLRRGVVEDVLDLVRRQADVDRVEHGARLDHAVVRLEQVVGVEGDERHPVAGRDAELDERVGEAVRPGRECAVGELARRRR